MSGDTLPRTVMKMGFKPMHMVRPQWISSSLPPVVTSGMTCWVKKKVIAFARDQATTPPHPSVLKWKIHCVAWTGWSQPTRQSLLSDEPFCIWILLSDGALRLGSTCVLGWKLRGLGRGRGKTARAVGWSWWSWPRRCSSWQGWSCSTKATNKIQPKTVRVRKWFHAANQDLPIFITLLVCHCKIMRMTEILWTTTGWNSGPWENGGGGGGGVGSSPAIHIYVYEIFTCGPSSSRFGYNELRTLLHKD